MRAAGGPGGSAPGAERRSGKGRAAGPPPTSTAPGPRLFARGEGGRVGRGVCQRARSREGEV